MKSIRFFTCSSAVALLLSATAVSAQESPFKFEFHGFVTGSMYYQDQAFALMQGQGLLLAAPVPANAAPYDLPGTPPAGAATKSGSLLGGDVRNSRFSFGVTGPTALGGTPRGYLELDFFAPVNNGAGTIAGGGNFGNEQPLPRLRVAIAELKLGSTVIQVGQQNQLVIPQIPASIAHIANPTTYAAGSIGWRTPGIRVVHTLPVGAFKLELAAEAVKNKWNDVNYLNETSPATISPGQASGLPMFQGRLKLDGKAGDVTFSAYAVGVYHQVNLEGFGTTTPGGVNGKKTLSGNVVEVGGNLRVSLVSLAANFYTGKATGNLLGAIAQFGDIADTGYWAQLGVNPTKEIGIYALYGANTPDEDDVRKWNGTRLKNQLIGGMVRYAQAGYQVGIEGYQYTTTWVTGATTDKDESALQIIATAGYFF